MAQNHNILVICTGNTCRSPMAATLLQKALNSEQEPLNQIIVKSAGIAAFPGEPASDNSVAVLKKVNIDLSQHKSQPVTKALIENASIILGMTDSHLDALRYQENLNLPKHVYRFREFMGEPSEGNQIPDPFGKDFDAYQKSFDSMVEAIPSLITFIKKVCY